MVAYSFKHRFVDAIRRGLSTGLEDQEAALRREARDRGIDPDVFIKIAKREGTGKRPKRQTIRAVGRRRHARPGETLQLYCGMRTRQCFKIGESRCTSVDSIEIDVREHVMPIRIWGDWLKDGRIHDFARADGFDSAEDMLQFWKDEHGIGNFRGVLIRWEPLA